MTLLCGYRAASAYKYLFDPMLTTPGVYMETPGVSDETERINVIAYLRTLSETPIPLP